MNLVCLRVKGTRKGGPCLVRASSSASDTMKPWSLLATIRSPVFAIARVPPSEQLASGASVWGELEGGQGETRRKGGCAQARPQRRLLLSPSARPAGSL